MHSRFDFLTNPMLALVSRDVPAAHGVAMAHAATLAAAHGARWGVEFLLARDMPVPSASPRPRVRHVPAVAALPAPPPPSTSDAEAFDALRPIERAQLKKADHARYQRMRNAWLVSQGTTPAAYEAKFERRVFAGGRPVQRQRRSNGQPLAVTPTHSGQRFEEMRPIDLHVLKRDNPAHYAAMRDDAQARGAI